MSWAEAAGSAMRLIREHEAWAAPAVLVLAFLESFAFISLLVPATLILLGIGAMIGAAGLSFPPIFAAAAIGAFLGDWAAFEIALWLGPRVSTIWPISRNPQLLERASLWFARWGMAAIFFGRFVGPLRAAVPLVAGIVAMPRAKFQIANVASAVVWAAGILAPGAFGLRRLLG